MGVFSSRDLFSPKFTTAIISDSNNRWFPVPIKHVIGDFFLAEIEGMTYVFKLDPIREKTYRAKGIKSVKIIMYDTNHYLPVSAKNNTELEQFLAENQLPRVNNMLLRAMDYIGKREPHNPKDFKPLNLSELFEKVATEQEEYATEANNLKMFFENLDVKQIVKPVKKISEFLIDDLLVTSPQFHGSVLQQVELVDQFHKKVTNQPKTAKTNWMVIILLLSIVGMALGGIVYLNSTGAFSHILPTLPTIGPQGSGGTTSGGKLTDDYIEKTYPTPKSIVDAIHSQEISCTQLSDTIKKMVNTNGGGGVPGTCP